MMTYIWLLLWLVVSPLSAQTLTVLNPLNFANVEVATSPLAGDITMGTNGSISYPAGTSGSGAVAAQVQIGGTVGSVVTLACNNSAVLGQVGSNTKITLSPVKISVAAGEAYAAATTCNRINRSVLTHTLSSNTSLNIVYMAGLLQTSGQTLTSNQLTTAAGGGAKPISLRVVYQ